MVAVDSFEKWRSTVQSLKKVLNVADVQGQKVSLSDYTHIRAYHACRPIDVNSYKENGVHPFSREEALQEAIHKLSDERITPEKICEEFDKLWEDIYHDTSPKVWLMLETEELLQQSTHYLLYGSEFLNALAMQLWCREKLRKVGTPTLVICDVPLEDISDVWLKDLEKDIRHKATSERSIAVSAVAPENIVDFIYPDGWVIDPYSWRKVRLVMPSKELS